MSAFRITSGFTEDERDVVATLYWEAFSRKLTIGLGSDNKGIAFLARVADPRFALCARNEDDVLLGIAGFKTAQGAPIGGGFADLSAVYGVLSTSWRAVLLSFLERDLEDGSLLMDGICVTKQARGMGLGTALLRAIKDEGRARDCSDVRLDVIDSNPRAKALYEREGFVTGRTTSLGPLKYLFGFSSATEIRFAL